MSTYQDAGAPRDESPAEGTDPTGAVTVTIDPTNRVSDVSVVDRDEIRRPAGLAEAFEAAYSAALTDRLARRRAARPPEPPGPRPVAVSTRPVFRPITESDLQRHRIRNETPKDRPRGEPGEVTGVSRNDCVHVALLPAQSRGSVSADPGWLAHAQTTNIASALVEAFTDAYRQRDHA